MTDVTLGLRLDGSRDRRQPQLPTKREAKKEEERLKLLKKQRKGKSYGGIPFEEFLEQYFWPQRTKLRGNTVRGYERDLKRCLLPAFASMPLENIDRYSIQRMISSCPTRKVATNARETLSSILSPVREMEIIGINPAGFRYECPPATKTDPEALGVRLTSFVEIERVVRWVHESVPDAPEERIVVLGLLHGLRKGEVLGLAKRWQAEAAFYRFRVLFVRGSNPSRRTT